MPTWEGERLETDMGWNGEGPFYYTSLPEPLLSSELARLANSASQVLINTRVDSVTFQPCLEEMERSQDRHFSLAIPGVGLLTGVFDGHGGHAAADFAVSVLPRMIADGLINSSRSVEDVSRVLYESIRVLDKQIQDGVTGLFANDVDVLVKLPEDAIDDIVKANHDKLLLGMTGTTALIALVDEKKENLWIANLGDCQAVMGARSSDGKWTAEILTRSHNGNVASEAQRIRDEHPGEPECLTRSRVLGAIAVTRAIGDLVFKIPAIYTSRVFLAPGAPPFRTHTPVGSVVLPRILTPPYLDAEADVTHYSLSAQPDISQRVLILCSDGLGTLALQENETVWQTPVLSEKERELAFAHLEQRAAEGWVKRAGLSLDTSVDDVTQANLALTILRGALACDDGIGGGNEDPSRLARRLTVEMDQRWMDDTTIQAIVL